MPPITSPCPSPLELPVTPVPGPAVPIPLPQTPTALASRPRADKWGVERRTLPGVSPPRPQPPLPLKSAHPGASPRTARPPPSTTRARRPRNADDGQELGRVWRPPSRPSCPKQVAQPVERLSGPRSEKTEAGSGVREADSLEKASHPSIAPVPLVRSPTPPGSPSPTPSPSAPSALPP